MVYTRIGYGGFDNGTLVSKPYYSVKVEPGLVYSFKVTAVNRGGESFPSEILSAYKAKRERERILIINGFDRISGPAVINTPDKAGFDLEQDPGVPYLSNISFCGAQSGFNRSQAGKEGEGSLGHSGRELEGMEIAGNTFDYPFIHGKAIQAAGKYSFVSCSDEAVENGIVTLEDYPIVDYILGLEKEDPIAKAYYKTFSSPMQRLITSYCQSGGHLFVSGAYVGSDMSGTQGNREFTEKVLKYGYQNSLTDKSSGQINGLGRSITIPACPMKTVMLLQHRSGSSRISSIYLCTWQSVGRHCLQRGGLSYLYTRLSFRKHSVRNRSSQHYGRDTRFLYSEIKYSRI